MMSRSMLLSSSCVLVFLLCLSSYECNGRHLSTIEDDHAIKGLENNSLAIHDDLNLKKTEKMKDETNKFDDHKDRYKRTDCGGSKNKKDKIKDQKVKKFKDLVHHHHKSINFHVPLKNKRIHQQPGFNLDYSPPKTHPPSHN